MPKSYLVEDKTAGNTVKVSVQPEEITGYRITKYENLLIQASNLEPKYEFNPVLPEYILGNEVQVKVSLKTFNAKLILNTLESLVKIPHGCFEQMSASILPLALLLQYINAIGKEGNILYQMKGDVEKNLRAGLNKLLLYKDQKWGGFSWFGRIKSDLTLNALALWQFLEINKSKQYVDQKEIERLVVNITNEYRPWEKSFEETNYPFVYPVREIGYPYHDPHITYGTSPDFKNILNAFIIFVLSEQQKTTSDSKKIINEILKRMSKENPYLDTYLHSLIGLTLLNVNQKKEAHRLSKMIATSQHRRSGEFKPGNTSIMRSRGKNLIIESTALAVIFLQRVDFALYSEEIKKGLHFLLGNMKDGHFGSTQGTVLALKALIENALKLDQMETRPVKFKLKLGDVKQVVGSEEGLIDQVSRVFDLSNEKILLSIDPLSKLNDAQQVFLVEYTFFASEPENNQNSLLDLKVSRDSIDQVEKYRISLKNKSFENQGMVMLGIHKPSYSRLNLNDLNQLVSSGMVDFYEIRDDSSLILFYWRELESEEEKTIQLVLVSQFKFVKRDPVFVEAYLYYDKEGSIVTQKV